MKALIHSLAVMVLCAPVCWAEPIYGNAADLTGSRNGDDLIRGGNYASRDLSVDWRITSLDNATWSYSYTFSGFRQPEISHIILDLTDDAVVPFDDRAVTDITLSSGNLGKVEFGTYQMSPSNPGFPNAAELVGVKFNTNSPGSSFLISFTSNRAPVWGDVYVKGGSSSYAYNAGLTLHASSTNPRHFIARPNGVVPEPGSLAMIGIGLAVLGAIRRRHRLQASR